MIITFRMPSKLAIDAILEQWFLKCQGDSNLPLPYRIPDQETPSRSSRPLSVSSHDKYSGEVESPVLCYISPITINIVISIDRADL